MADWCNDYHCAGDCGLPGHGQQHKQTETRCTSCEYFAQPEPAIGYCYMFRLKPAGQCLSYREKDHG